jgi:hypothetical protein
MKTQMKRWALASVLAALWALGGTATAADPADPVEEVESCVEANLPRTASIQTVRLVSRSRAGSERTLAGRIHWKRGEGRQSKALVEIEAPEDMRGSAFLILQKEERSDMFVYLPELRRVRRISGRTASGSMFGTDLSYEDAERLQRMAKDARVERKPDANEAGREAFVLEAVPADETKSEYQGVRSFIDRETCTLLKAEFLGRGGRVAKVVTVDPAALGQQGGVWYPREILVRDLEDATQTQVIVEKIEIDPEIPDRLFTESNLARGN